MKLKKKIVGKKYTPRNTRFNNSVVHHIGNVLILKAGSEIVDPSSGELIELTQNAEFTNLGQAAKFISSTNDYEFPFFWDN